MAGHFLHPSMFVNVHTSIREHVHNMSESYQARPSEADIHIKYVGKMQLEFKMVLQPHSAQTRVPDIKGRDLK